MKISARNVFRGKISALVDAAVNAEIELILAGGDKIVAIVTEESVKSLGLAVGMEALAYVKAPWVMLLAGPANMKFSAPTGLGVAQKDQFAVDGQVPHTARPTSAPARRRPSTRGCGPG